MRAATTRAVLARVAELLGPELRREVVFVGGGAVPLLVTDEGAPPDRPTYDVDIVVEATSPATYLAISDRLRARGFAEDRDDPPIICRWRHGPHRIDVMPVDGTFMGFRGARFHAVRARPWELDLGEVVILVARAPELVATKIEAFFDRGDGDFVVSKDMEDILSLVNGRDELVAEVADAPHGVRRFVAATVETWLDDASFLDALPGQLAGDDARLPLVIARLRAIAALAKSAS